MRSNNALNVSFQSVGSIAKSDFWLVVSVHPCELNYFGWGHLHKMGKYRMVRRIFERDQEDAQEIDGGMMS